MQTEVRRQAGIRLQGSRWAAIVSAAIGWGALVLFSVAPAGGDETTAIELHDVTSKTGIRFRHTDGSFGERYLVETVSAGLATFDYDRDGAHDIYFLNGAAQRGQVINPPPLNALYRNQGNWQFADVTTASGLGDPGFGMGIAVADYDQDGFADVFLNNFGPNALYHNNGDGTFANVTRRTGLSSGNEVGAGACFFDVEGDGDLDLYVANYIQFSYADVKPTYLKGNKIYPGPLMHRSEKHWLYRNNGDGTFTNVSAEAGMGELADYGMGVVAADLDDDGDTDVLVANDTTANLLLINDGRGHFRDEGLARGVAYDYRGEAQGNMGVEVGDFNNDGLLDAFLTSYRNELTCLYQNDGGALFRDVTLPTGAGSGTYQRVNWGTGLIDFDHDGDRDLFIANGHTHDNIDLFDGSSKYRQPNQLLENRGGRFVDVSKACGDGLVPVHSSRGAAFDDLDNDGDIDGVVLNSREGPTIIENCSRPRGGWIEIQLVGRRTNRDGVGARVRVTSGGRVQVAEVHSGRGYQSHYGTRLHFGLGRQERVEKIEVRWIGGGRDAVRDVPGGQIVRIAEGGDLQTLNFPNTASHATAD